MRVKIARQDTYVPRWRGNRDLPESEQVKVHYHYMTAEQEERFSTIYMHRDEDESMSMKVETHANEVWLECVDQVLGLYGEDDKPITAPKDVLKIPGVYELITEVVGVIKKGLTEADEKNS